MKTMNSLFILLCLISSMIHGNSITITIPLPSAPECINASPLKLGLSSVALTFGCVAAQYGHGKYHKNSSSIIWPLYKAAHLYSIYLNFRAFNVLWNSENQPLVLTLFKMYGNMFSLLLSVLGFAANSHQIQDLFSKRNAKSGG